ncbi:parafibromin [Drosophila rhopaloa]|uniref:Parafibromin n=1 Tax=Drosophila rhopaloa TaxID=1041015 RepID=A0ABM5H4R3_DRORH|nr:parafibromin [Drosophila rhopaloa]
MDTNSMTLAQTMTVEAIAAIKSKRLAMKRVLDDVAQRERMMQREINQQKHEEQAEICRRAMERERQHRSRDELMLGEKELPGVLQTLALVYDSKKRRMLSRPEESFLEETIAPPAPETVREVPVVPPQPETMDLHMDKYNRYGQERFLKSQQEFDINPQGNYLEKVGLAGTNINQQSSHLENVGVAGINLNPEQTNPPAVNQQIANTADKVENPQKIARLRSWMPIIVVPQSVTSLITIHNARQLLQEMRYLSVEKARLSYRPYQYPDEVIIERRFQGELVGYRIIDNVTRLTAEEWGEVVAVFALGPSWQFKGWPQFPNLALIFRQVCAFHLHFKDSPPLKELLNLPVHMLALPLNERHSDCGIVAKFWNKVDRHMAVHHRQFAFMRQK